MSDVFVSYSRRDAAFVGRLTSALRDGGREVWVDTEGIADAEHFPDALREAIESADAFVFVITGAAAGSRYCRQEIDHAMAMGKRIVPLLRDPVPDDDLHPEIRDRNWIPFTEDQAFEVGVERLDRALTHDLAHAKAHTRWLTRSLEWEAAGRSSSLLPRGEELSAAESWLAAAGPGADPQPTELQRELLLAARRAATRRSRRTVAVSTAVTAVSLILLVFAILAQRSATHGRTLARSQALAARSEGARELSPVAALRLATQALETAPTREAQRAAKAALDANPLIAVAGPFATPTDTGACTARMLSARPGADELATVVCDGTVRVLDGRTGRVLRRLRPGPDPSAVAYSPDGDELAVLVDGAVVVLDAGTGRRRASIRLPGGRVPAKTTVYGANVVWSADGQHLAALAGERAYLAGRRSGRARSILGGQQIWGTPAFVGDQLALGTDDRIEVFDARSGAHRRTVPVSDGPRYGFAQALVAMPGGRRLIVGRYTAGDEGRVELWDARTWRRLRTVATIPFQSVGALAVSPDGSRIAYAASIDHVDVVSVNSGRILVHLPASTWGSSAAFSADARRLALVGGDSSRAVVSIVRAQGTEARYVEGRAERQDAVIATRTLLRAVADPSAGGVRVETWRRSDGHRLRDLVITPTGQRAFAFSPDGRFLVEARAGARDRPRVWDLDRRRVVRRLAPVTAGMIAVSARGDVVVGQGDMYGVGMQGPLLVTTLRGGAARQTQPPGRDLCGGFAVVRVSDDGSTAAAATLCNDVLLWDTRTGRRTATVHAADIGDMVLGPRGDRTAVMGADGTIGIWSVRPVRRLSTLRGGSGLSFTPGFTPDGRRMVVAFTDGTLRVWDTQSGRLLRELRLPGLQLGTAYAGNVVVLLADDRGVRELDVCDACEDTRALLARTRLADRLPLGPGERALIDGS